MYQEQLIFLLGCLKQIKGFKKQITFLKSSKSAANVQSDCFNEHHVNVT